MLEVTLSINVTISKAETFTVYSIVSIGAKMWQCEFFGELREHITEKPRMSDYTSLI